LLPGQNRDYSDENVDEIELQANGFGQWVFSLSSGLDQLGVVKDLLSVVENKGTKDSQSTVAAKRERSQLPIDKAGQEDYSQ
jgi:hypothetical protein